ncbi:MAG: hypothetical protein ABI903_12700 [Actinomycetota bacterium]
MKFCTGWYSRPDVQRASWDGAVPAARDFQDLLRQLVDLHDAGVACEDDLAVENVQTLSSM